MIDKAYDYLYKVYTLPPDVAIRKAFNKIKLKAADTVSKISAHLFGTEISNKEFLRVVKLEDLQAVRKLFCSKKNLWCLASQEEIIPVIRKYFPEASSKIIAAADKICEHTFDLLGSGEVSLGKTIDWHMDFKTGYRWNPGKYYRNIEKPYGRADIKIPWELSRFQHLATLGQAYWLTNDKRYTQEFVDQITDWVKNNPPKFGVNWACTMDVAIRAVNWIVGFYFFADAKKITDGFWLKFLKNLFSHGRFIQKNLEIFYNDHGKRITSNHYLSDIVGLVFLGVFFKETKEGKEWLNLGVKELVEEMRFQVHQDGADFESSIPYHRLVLELFAISAILCKINGIELPSEFWEQLDRMFEFVMSYTRPDGQSPQVGDNDNGRLLILSNYNSWEVNDHRYLLGIGAVLFDRQDLALACGGQWEDAFWLTNKLSKEGWIEKYLALDCLQSLKSKAFPDSGYYIMREKDNYVIISAGNVGTAGIGNHKHNDVFSFELCLGKKTFIIDPGTYVYTVNPEMRDMFRSTAYHNTVMIDDQEQNRFGRGLFLMKNDVMPRCLKWETGDEVDIFIGEHYGYKRLSQPVIHQREIRFYKKERKKGRLEIIDRFEGKGEHNLEWNLMLLPDVTEKIEINSDKLQWHRETAFYSSAYGIMCKTEKLTSTLKTTLPVEVKFWVEEKKL